MQKFRSRAGIRCNKQYVIITPAHNEERYIERTIRSVIAQTIKPTKWVIVDDGSSDNTATIVRQYLPSHDFICLITRERSSGRHFGKKVEAFNFGRNHISNCGYSYIGNIDADISFMANYFENILAEFDRQPRLGIAGGIIYTAVGPKYVTGDTNLGSVGGAVQLFRRECFEQIGGYIALEHGGIDAAAEILARMKGWLVRKFPENTVWEHRRTGSAGNGVLASMFKLGIRFHTLGWAPKFFVLRCIYRIATRPVVLASMAMLIGFLWAKLKRYPFSLPDEAVAHVRGEQSRTLRRVFVRRAEGLGK